MTPAERDAVLEEAAKCVLTHEVLQGDQYGHWMSLSHDAIELADAIRALKEHDAPQENRPPEAKVSETRNGPARASSEADAPSASRSEPEWGVPDPEFDAWVKTLPQKYWAKYDLSACRLGWHAARSEQRTLPKEGPRRACVLTVLLEADTKEDMLRALSSMGQALARDELTKGTWGSPGHGCIYEYSQGSTPTHDEYFEQTRAYLEQLRQQSGERNG